MPGPGIVPLVACAFGSGFWPSVAVRMILGDLIFLSPLVFGLAGAAHQLEGFFIPAKFIRPAYLIYPSFRIGRALVDEKTIAERRASGPVKMWVAGLVVTLRNPKTVLCFLAL